MKKLLISFGVVAMMFFAQAADVNAATCEEKAKDICNTYKSQDSDFCARNISCKQTSDTDKSAFCVTYCVDGR